jgi:transcriptional regulator with XRE-family HTH domain
MHDMDDVKLGRLLRMRRMRRGWRLEDVSRRSGLSTTTLARDESGAFGSVHVVRRHAGALDMRLEWIAIGRGADVARTWDEEHAAIVEVIAAWLRGLGLEIAAEASFSVYGERGRVDLLAFDAATGKLYLVEAKTELSDLGDVLGVVDVRERLAARLGTERGWAVAAAISILALADTPHNRGVVGAHAATFGGWSRARLRIDRFPSSARRQLLWIPAGAAGRSRWLAGRRRMGLTRAG